MAAFAIGSGAALFVTTQGVTANASVPSDAATTNESIAPSDNNNNAITLAEKPFLVEHGKQYLRRQSTRPTGDIAQGQILISTEDGSENGTVFFTEIGQNEKGIGVAYFTTNSTGKLAFLDNLVAVLQDELQPSGNTSITVWEWKGEH